VTQSPRFAAQRLRARSTMLTFAGALLATSAFTAPAFAQIETVTVTAEKRSADQQTVPVTVTAYTAEDLKAHQVTQFKDLVQSTPNVSYTKGNFAGADFQIRGIGIAAVSGDAESGVAVHQDDVFLAAPPLAEATFYDLERVEILRGPQSTLYGRGATGGNVNIVTAKPDMDEMSGNLEGAYGNYDAAEVKGYFNLPLTDNFAMRVAGDWIRHDGYVTNIANNTHIDGQNTYSIRTSLRWQPTSKTTIDLVGSYSHESDDRMRSQRQLCAYDPTGTLGCLPDSLGHDAINNNSTLTTIFSSTQAFALAGLPTTLGLFDLTTPGPHNVNPADARQVSTDFTPDYKATDRFFAFNLKQQLNDWLDFTAVVGFDSNYVVSHESYNNSVSLPLDPVRLATAEATFLGALTALGGPGYAAHYAPYFTTVPGSLPVSGTTNLGLAGGDIAYYSPNASGYDQSNGQAKQYSAEFRLASSLEGPLNFLLAGYFLSTSSASDYFVNASTFDYPSIVFGGFQGLTDPATCFATGCLLAPGFYRSQGNQTRLQSMAAFGEVYYEAIPDTLKFTGGIRFTEDEKHQLSRIQLLTGLLPIGTTDLSTSVLPYDYNEATFDQVTGRFVVDYTPKLDFTDATLIYASYSRGYKAGGFNPGVQPGLGVPVGYNSEGIDALELGTKNTLLDGVLQANMTAWYYNYENLQVSAIINNTSVNQNIGARLWGVEGEFKYQPDDKWQFSLNFGHTDSRIGNVSLVDQRNPTAGRSDVVLVKDATPTGTAGQNCVYYAIAAGTPTPAALGVPGFFAPPGGDHALAAHGVANTNYGVCGLDEATANSFGYSTIDPLTGKQADGGVAVNLHGNQLQNTPPWTISFGVQYTFDFDGGYTLTPRADFYWQDNMYGRIFNDAADKISSWEVTNAQVTFAAEDSKWYATAYIKNVFDENNVTGQYLTSATSGLYTNEFLGDPRTYGLRLGVRF
jgi:outer membrane receptor protein involved in Fe transport